MKKLSVAICICFSISLSYAQEKGIINNSESPFVKLKSINISDCQWTKGFWADRFELMHKVGIPNMWHLLSDSTILHSKQNFLIAAGIEKGKSVGTNWLDGDTYKWLEAGAYVYAITRDKKLDSLMDDVIGDISKAQQPDGYIDTRMTILGKEHFQDVQDHEMYNMGHLMTAACIHYRATGKTTFLDVAKKAGDCLITTFMNTNKYFLGYSSIMGLVELYRTTGDKKYLDLASHFVNTQGTGNTEERRKTSNDRLGTDARQDRIPIRQETEAIGHGVRGDYFYCGATDVYAETGDTPLLAALERIWGNMIYKKMYITGGVSSQKLGVSPNRDLVWEGYSNEYQLNNVTAYNETCSNIGNAMWNWRMLSVTGDSKYADVMERIIYNSALSAISLDGKHFFYTNPLQRVNNIAPQDKNDSTRWLYQSGFCCPPNIIRTLAKLSGWAYSLAQNGLTVNLYGGNKLNTHLLDGSKIQLTQETQYPWNGDVKITMEECKKELFEIMLRIPEWAVGSKIMVNGKDAGIVVKAGKYAKIDRQWKKGDVLTLNMPMDVKLVEGNSLVEEDRNQVAIKRGPVVYCVESPDLPKNEGILNVYLPGKSNLKAQYRPEFLGGLTTISGNVLLREDKEGISMYHDVNNPKWQNYKTQFIPYYAWDNRGKSEMSIWMPIVWGVK